MKFRFLPMFFLAALPFLGNAQQRNCGTMEHHQQLLQQDPSMQSRLDQIEAHTRQFEKQHGQEKVTGIVYTIPVVVHVVYNGAAQNISDAQVQSQIDVLNKDFRLLNPDNVNVPALFAGLKSDVEINFCLAKQDPNGNPTTGITRTATTRTSFGTTDAVKSTTTGGVNPWNTAKYLNMWCCAIGGGILGYAQFPGGPAATDGVVMDYQYFGLSGAAAAPYNLGRTATHEVGHWLNLRHIWGDATCGSDLVNDTPTHNTANYGCPAAGHLSTCTGTPVEMTMNYMDYTDDACMYMFSAGQTTRMRALFAAGGLRESLISSTGCATSSACGTPSNLRTSNITNTTAVLNWDAIAGATSYTVQYRTSASTTFTTTTTSNTSLNVAGLTLGTAYVYQVSATCATGTSGNSSLASFTTTGGTVTCGIPTTLTSSAVSATGATLNWAAVTGASSYNIQYKTSAAATFTNTTSTTNSVVVSGLTAATTYVFNVQAVCSGTAGVFSSQGSFTTSSATSSYCASKGNAQTDEWIDRVSLNNLLRTSTADAGYIYSTTTTANVVANTSYALGYSAGFRTGYTATEFWRIWIDYNKNGVFTDAGELVVSRSSASASNLSTTIRIPSTAKNGLTRMRVSMKWNSAQTSSCETFSYGEVEDYNINITGGVNREAGDAAISEEVIADNSLQLFPNPASDKLTIQRSEIGWMNGSSLLMVDMQGKVWKNEVLNYQEGQEQIELNTSVLPSGLYNLVIFSGQEKVSRKVMILHP